MRIIGHQFHYKMAAGKLLELSDVHGKNRIDCSTRVSQYWCLYYAQVLLPECPYTSDGDFDQLQWIGFKDDSDNYDDGNVFHFELAGCNYSCCFNFFLQ